MMRGRPRQFDPDAALERAIETFWSRGYQATSMQDLLRATALSKSSLYQQYGDKARLFSRCLERYCDAHARRLRAQLERSATGLAFIEHTLREIADTPAVGPGRRGCLLMNTATELGSRAPWVASRLSAGRDAFAGVFETAVRRAQAEGAISPARDPATLALYLVNSVSGLHTLLKAGTDRAEAHAVVDSILRALR